MSVQRQRFEAEAGERVRVLPRVAVYGGQLGMVEEVVRLGTSQQRPTLLGVRMDASGQVADFAAGELEILL